MPCRRKYKRIRAKDVGRLGHHYIKFGVLPSIRAGVRGGVTERIGGLRRYKRKGRR